MNLDQRIKALVKLGEFLIGQNLTTNGRTLENLGLEGMTPQAIQQYLDTGMRV